MTARICVEIRALPGAGERLIEVMKKFIPETASRDGAIDLELVRDEDDKDRILIFERWRSRADHEDYLAWRAESGAGRAELDAVMSSMQITYGETIATW
jgi:quinol monooxygenase YgiN